jgi:hypothetical protein
MPSSSTTGNKPQNPLQRPLLTGSSAATATLVSIGTSARSTTETAWDPFTSRVFLGYQDGSPVHLARLRFTLAAPLVLDLARFAERAARDGQSGPLTQLACFFKSPLDVAEHAFTRQYEELVSWAQRSNPKPRLRIE